MRVLIIIGLILSMVLIAGCNYSSYDAQAAAPYYQPRCNILFESNYNYVLSVNGFDFNSYSGGICTSDRLGIFYSNNSGYHDLFVDLQVASSYNSNVLRDANMPSPIDNLTMVLYDGRNSWEEIIDVYPGESRNYLPSDNDVYLEVQIAEVNGSNATIVPDLTCVIDYSNRALVGDIFMAPLTGDFTISNTYTHPRFYATQSVYSEVVAFDVINKNKKSSLNFHLVLSPMSSRDLSNETLKISCYSKEFFSPRGAEIWYDVENKKGQLISKNIMERTVYIKGKSTIDKNKDVIDYCTTASQLAIIDCMKEVDISGCKPFLEGWRVYCITYFEAYPWYFKLMQESNNESLNFQIPSPEFNVSCDDGSSFIMAENTTITKNVSLQKGIACKYTVVKT